MKRILITGAKGQLGLELTKQLSDSEKYELYLTDVTSSSHSIIALDISDEQAVQKVLLEYKPDIIINCAAVTAVDLCENEEKLAFQINAEGPRILANTAEGIGATLIHISTDYVFDGNKSESYTEEDETNPINVYGKSKLTGENNVLKYCSKAFILRTAWVYGEGKNFVNTMLKLAEGGKPLRIVNDQYGSPTSTLELARVIIFLMETESYGLYHATCEGSICWYEFALTIFKEAGLIVEVNPVSTEDYPTPAKRPRFSVLDNTRLKEWHGYKMKHWLDAYREYYSH